jgi:protein-disulfide isomerase
MAKPEAHTRRRRATPTIALAASLVCGSVVGDPVPGVAAPSTEEAKELELLRSMARQTRSTVKSEDFVLSIDGHPAIGRPEAAVTVIEFTDLQCGFCRRHFNSTFPVLVERYVDTGRARYVFFDFPVDARHPAAQVAAIAARCAADQNVVRPMRQHLLASAEPPGPEQLREHAVALGLDGAAFSRCLDDDEKPEAVQRDLALGRQLMIRGTPTFLVGSSQAGSAQVRVVRRIVGAQPLDVFEAAIAAVAAEAHGALAHRPSPGPAD